MRRSLIYCWYTHFRNEHCANTRPVFLSHSLTVFFAFGWRTQHKEHLSFMSFRSMCSTAAAAFFHGISHSAFGAMLAQIRSVQTEWSDFHAHQLPLYLASSLLPSGPLELINPNAATILLNLSKGGPSVKASNEWQIRSYTICLLSLNQLCIHLNLFAQTAIGRSMNTSHLISFSSRAPMKSSSDFRSYCKCFDGVKEMHTIGKCNY